jgi:aryl-alcohol dehydrogenase-like predicted oxidoreductase
MMMQRKLGHTGLRVTPIGFGLAALGRPAYINIGHKKDFRRTDVDSVRKQAFKTLDMAWEKGIRYFDCARSYGRAEEFLAEWMDERRISPDEVTVGSKWGYRYVGNWKVDTDKHEIKEHTRATLTRQWAETQFYLGRHLNLYQIHSANQASGVLQNDDVLYALWELKFSGTFIGLSVSGTDQAETLWQALEIQRDGIQLFDTVQATWNVLERSVSEALTAAHDAGWGVIIKEALANGRMSPRNANNSKFSGTYQIIAEQATRLNASVDAVALRYALEQPFADVVLSGVSKSRHLLSNLAALTINWDAEAETALDGLAEDPETYWQTRSQLRWN